MADLIFIGIAVVWSLGLLAVVVAIMEMPTWYRRRQIRKRLDRMNLR
jgi:hypothetical protein